MKKIFFALIILSLVACGKKSDSNTNNNNKNLDNGPLTAAEARILANNTWCQDRTTVQLSYKNAGQTHSCSTELTLVHDVTQFTSTEYFVEFRYMGGSVFCKKSFGNNGASLSNQNINDQLKDRGYRLSFTGKNEALLSNIGSDDSKEVSVFVGANQVNIVPADKNQRPVELNFCQ